MGGARLAEAGLERGGARPRRSRSSASPRSSRSSRRLRGALARARRRGPRAAARRRPSSSTFPTSTACSPAGCVRDRRAARLLRQPAGLGLAAWGRATIAAARAAHHHALPVRDRDLSARSARDAVCAGHPLVEDVRRGARRALAAAAEDPAAAGAAARQPAAPSSSATGRRLSEAAARLARRFDLEVVAVRAPGLPRALFAGARRARDPRSSRRACTRCSRRADLAFVASGTATLEAALCGAPDGRRLPDVRRSATRSRGALVRLRWISLVNIVAGEEVVPELLQDRLTVENLEREGADAAPSPGAARGDEGRASRAWPARSARPARAPARPSSSCPPSDASAADDDAFRLAR